MKSTIQYDQSGAILLQLLVGAAVLCSTFVFIMQNFVELNRQQRQRAALDSLAQIQANTESVLTCESCWAVTVANPEYRSQLLAGRPVSLPIYQADGSLWYRNLPTSGFNAPGLPCESFSTTTTGDCLIHAQVTAQLATVCTGCTVPAVDVTVSYTISSNAADYQNMNFGAGNSHNYVFQRPLNAVASSCIDQTPLHCTSNRSSTAFCAFKDGRSQWVCGQLYAQVPNPTASSTP